MKKIQVTHIKNNPPTSAQNISAGYNVGQWWDDTITGKKYFHKSDGVWELIGSDAIFSKSIISSGTTGAQTINKISGKVNAAAGTTSLVVTNNLVTTNSIVMAQVGTNDATCKSAIAVEANGYFTINYVAPTSETVIKFFVIN